MKQPKINAESLRHHFGYSWWSNLLFAAALVMFWSFAYSATEYVPPAEKSIYVNFAGAYVSDELIEDLTAEAYEAFPEMELIEFYGLYLDASDSENGYAANQKLTVMIAAGEGDVFLIDRSVFQSFAQIGAFQPLDELLEEGGLLEGWYTQEEIEEGTLEVEDLGLHCYGLPAERFYSYYDYGVDPRDYFLVRASYTRNPEYADKMLLFLTQHGMAAERPDWLDETSQREQEAQQEASQIAPIG